MPKEQYTPTPKLKLVLDHLKALRTLDEYVNAAGGLKADVQDLSNYLQPDLNRSLLRPAGWDDLYAEKGNLYSSPKSKWGVVRGDHIAMQIYLAWPVRDDYDDEPSVNLYVPENWKKRLAFREKLKLLPGFEHVGQYPDGEITETTPIFKYVPYAGQREAAKTLVAMESDIDRILERLG